MDKLASLRKWASERHGDQRYGEHSYDYHLKEVERVADEFFPGDMQLKQGCWGHDLIEDRGATAEELLNAGFDSEAVADVVAVSDVKAPTRKQRKLLTLPIIRQRGLSAIKLKLCDRIANVRFGKIAAINKNAMYRAEQAQLESELFDASHVELLPIWQCLRDLLAV